MRWPGTPRLPERLNDRENQIARQVLKEIRARLGFLMDVGLDYLTLDRAAGTLSGGEAQRIRLATQIGSSLMGVLYILDEPSHRPAPARQRPADRDAGAAARPGQHADRGRARRGDDPLGRLGDRHRARRRRARRRLIVARAAGRLMANHRTRHRRSTCAGDKAVAVPEAPAQGQRAVADASRGARGEQPARASTSPFPLGTFVAVTGVCGLGQVARW